MTLERWELWQRCGNQETNHRSRTATKTISRAHAADGWCATCSGPGVSARGVCLEPEPSGALSCTSALARGAGRKRWHRHRCESLSHTTFEPAARALRTRYLLDT